MVEYHHGGSQRQQLLALRHAGAVDIADHQHGICIHHTEGTPAGDDHVAIIIIPLKAVDHGTDGLRILIQNDEGLSAQGRHQTIDAHSRTEGIRIRTLMGHDDDTFLVLKKLLKGLGLYTGLNSGGLLGSGTLSAKVGDLFTVLQSYLIASAAKGQTDGNLRILKGIREASSSCTDTDGKGHGDLISHIQILYIIQKGEPVLLQRLYVFLTEDKEILVVLQTLYDGVDVGKIHVDLPVHQCIQDGVLYLLKGVHYFIIVVNIYQTRKKLLVKGLLFQTAFVGHIEEVHNDYHVVALLLLLVILENRGEVHSPDHRIEPAVSVLYVHAELTHHIRKDIRGKLRKIVLDSAGKELLLIHADGLVEHGIGPKDLSVRIQQRIGHRQAVKQLLLNLSLLQRIIHHGGLHHRSQPYVGQNNDQDIHRHYYDRDQCLLGFHPEVHDANGKQCHRQQDGHKDQIFDFIPHSSASRHDPSPVILLLCKAFQALQHLSVGFFILLQLLLLFLYLCGRRLAEEALVAQHILSALDLALQTGLLLRETLDLLLGIHQIRKGHVQNRIVDHG